MAPSRPVDDTRGWLEARLRQWVSQARGPGRDALDPAGLDVVKLHEEGRYGEAEAAARRLVDALRETRGERHPHYATALSNLALLLQKQGNHLAAEPLLREVLDIRREALGERHPHYATALNNLALLLCKRADLAGAEPLLREALDIRREALGDRHPDHATSLTSLAMLLCERGDLAGAEPLLREALEIRRETLGEHHPQYVTALCNLALLLRERGNPAAAEPLLSQALEIRRETLGEQHPDTVSCDRALKAVRRAAPTDRPAPRREPRLNVQALRNEVDALADRFVRASELMADAAPRMRSLGVLPDADVLESAAICQYEFGRLRTAVLRLAQSVGVPPAEVVGLVDLSALLDAAAVAESALRRYEETRDRAEAWIAQSLTLECRHQSHAETLRSVHAHAHALRQSLDTSPPPNLPADADQLAAGQHPLAMLLTLAQNPADLDDATWADLFQTVSTVFGRPVAVAVACRKIALPEPDATPLDDDEKPTKNVHPPMRSAQKPTK